MSKSIRKAVSVIFRCGEKIFIIKRQNYLRAFPGYTAFPGGKKDKEDIDLETTVRREILEELNFEIPPTKKIVQIAKATSPDFNPIRFETYFYLIDLEEVPLFHVDENEFAMFEWIFPKDILFEYTQGKRLIVPPIKMVIDRLVSKNEDFIDFDEKRFDAHSVPSIETIYGLKQIMPLSNTIFPATRTNSFLFGEKIRTLVDPSPKNEEELEKLIKTLENESIDQILITHHHGDHHQFSPQLATFLNVKILISEDSYQRILKKSKNYFKNNSIQFLKDGDIIGDWQNQNIIAHHIPGHDEGHFALAPENLAWMIVGDLFQGIGTVVVGGDEGDMLKYMRSLEKVILMRPACVIPSHGIALGGTDMIEKTLKHRKLREKQVLELTLEGKTIDQILNLIYFNIPEGVLKYAKANINSHLEKLKKEQKI